MAGFVYGWGMTASALALITAVFFAALFSLRRELRYVRALTDYLAHDLAGGELPEGSLLIHAIRDDAVAVLESSDPSLSIKQIRGWSMRAQRLEPALAFWVDFLRQLGLLFTVVGLGLSLGVGAGERSLLEPLGLAVWTTVAGLFYSVWLSALFGMKIPVWTDTCEKNIEAWSRQREQR